MLCFQDQDKKAQKEAGLVRGHLSSRCLPQDLGFLSHATPALHSPLLLSTPPTSPLCTSLPPGSRAPLLSILPANTHLSSGRSEGFPELQVRMGGPPRSACRRAPCSSLCCWCLCVPAWAGSLRWRGDPLLLARSPQCPAQSHHAGYPCDGWMNPYHELVA